MVADSGFQETNTAKADMSHIYDQRDPRAYFRELKKLDYAIPGLAKSLFQKLISKYRKVRNDRADHQVQLLDVGCSYGVNAALLKHDLTMDDLYRHWQQTQLTNASSTEVIEYDRNYFTHLDQPADLNIIGLDVAENAVAFAAETGLIDEGLTVDLEENALPPANEKSLEAVDLVTSTGCIGYVTEKSFSRLLPVVTRGDKPWFANFVLRMFPFEPIEETLNESGYVTEKLEGQTFVQRRFASSDEQEGVIEHLIEQGIEPAGYEENGSLLAEFYLSRPAADAAATPLQQLLGAEAHGRAA